MPLGWMMSRESKQALAVTFLGIAAFVCFSAAVMSLKSSGDCWNEDPLGMYREINKHEVETIHVQTNGVRNLDFDTAGLAAGG